MNGLCSAPATDRVTAAHARMLVEVTMANAFVHVELMTTDVGRAKEFFSKLFDWKLEETTGAGDMAYTMIKVGEGTGGGIMKNPMPNAGSLWVAYVEVDNVIAATAKAKSLGGQ
jgi:predicted enzyme related to lactoylglutathione lyase